MRPRNRKVTGGMVVGDSYRSELAPQQEDHLYLAKMACSVDEETVQERLARRTKAARASAPMVPSAPLRGVFHTGQRWTSRAARRVTPQPRCGTVSFGQRAIDHHACRIGSDQAAARIALSQCLGAASSPTIPNARGTATPPGSFQPLAVRSSQHHAASPPAWKRRTRHQRAAVRMLPEPATGHGSQAPLRPPLLAAL